MKFRISDIGKVLGGMKVISFRAMGINVKRSLYEEVDVPTPLYGAEAWSMAAAEKKRLNIMEIRCLRSMCGVTRVD